jgi:hypothetical protein
MTVIMRILTDLFPVRRPVSRLRAAPRHRRVHTLTACVGATAASAAAASSDGDDDADSV